VHEEFQTWKSFTGCDGTVARKRIDLESSRQGEPGGFPKEGLCRSKDAFMCLFGKGSCRAGVM